MINIILTRSPHFIVTDIDTIISDEVGIELFIYRGHRVTDKPAAATYSLSKKPAQLGQTSIVFDISKFANDFCKSDLTPLATGTGTYTSNIFDSVWVYATVTRKLNGTVITTENFTYLAVDAYGYHFEGANPFYQTNVLSTIQNHIVFNDSILPIYFKTENLESIVINGVNVPFTYNIDYSNQVIGYVNAAAYKGMSEEFQAVFTYTPDINYSPVHYDSTQYQTT